MNKKRETAAAGGVTSGTNRCEPGRLAVRASREPRLRVTIRGAVQGVGFRPFVFRLANELGLRGWVNNSAQGVFIEVEGAHSQLETFLLRLEAEKPPRSFIQSLEPSWLDAVGYQGFEIRPSETGGTKTALVLPDIATCPDCLREIFDPGNRRYRYPFTNCTNCGPRFSIIESLPYDRANTSMRAFRMCPACQAEYDDPRDRRFHAQPNACPACGPQLALWDQDGRVVAGQSPQNETLQDWDALVAAADAIREGKILAVKGLGGFHLMVAACNDEAVQRLRELKHREEKPFALMFPSLEAVKSVCEVNAIEERLLRSAEAPIVLLRRVGGLRLAQTPHPNPLPFVRLHQIPARQGRGEGESSAGFGVGHTTDSSVEFAAPSAAVAPGNPNLGVMLPYTPLHHLLLSLLKFPVVATSGNLSDEPICIDEHEALDRLKGIADYFLVHNRPIVRHVDDSIVRVMAGRELVLRRARGYAPLPVQVRSAECGVRSEGAERRNVLAVGAHLKNAIALSVGPQVFISQHIGDLETDQAYEAFRRVITDFGRLYESSPAIVVADEHPDYLSTKFARDLTGQGAASADSSEKPGRQGERARLVSVQHHLAHVLSCMAENELEPPVLGVSWDGTGYGPDGTVWGGEFIVVRDMNWQRFAHLRQFRLPGGDKAVKEPRRTALGLLFELFRGQTFTMKDLASVRAFSREELAGLEVMLSRGVNSPLTSSAGRLFDAVASLAGLRQAVRFEGQAAMELEFALDGVITNEAYSLKVSQSSLEPSPGSSPGGQVPSTPEASCITSHPVGASGVEGSGAHGVTRPTGPHLLDWAPMISSILEDLRQNLPAARISAKFHNGLVEGIVSVARFVGEERVVLSGGCFQNRYLAERAIQRLGEEGFQPYWHQRVPPNDGGIALGQAFGARVNFTPRA